MRVSPFLSDRLSWAVGAFCLGLLALFFSACSTAPAPLLPPKAIGNQNAKVTFVVFADFQ